MDRQSHIEGLTFSRVKPEEYQDVTDLLNAAYRYLDHSSGKMTVLQCRDWPGRGVFQEVAQSCWRRPWWSEYEGFGSKAECCTHQSHKDRWKGHAQKEFIMILSLHMP